MSVRLDEFTIRIQSPLISTTAINYRPPSWPPPRDWPVVIDKDGVVVSRWGDPTWRLDPWAGKRAILNFGDGAVGKAESLDPENADVMRMVATWMIWGGEAAGSVATVVVRFSYIRQIVALCSRNKISAARLMRHNKVFELVPGIIPPSKYGVTISLLHRLHDARNELGFVIIDPAGLTRLMSVAPAREEVQTPYIPPRIWGYQVRRLYECVQDFRSHQDRIEACFKFCLEAYSANYGSLEAALTPGRRSDRAFGEFGTDGTFSETAKKFGISEVLDKWIDWDEEKLSVRVLAAYMSLVTFAGLAYVANFTLQRKEEVASLRADCLEWDEDETLGPVPIVCGPTTKTNRDSDARWVASRSVEPAIAAVSAIARLRMECDRVNPLVAPSAADQANPYLFSAANEPWGSAMGAAKSYAVRQPLLDMPKAIERYSKLFDREQLCITSEDLAIARRLTPNLPEAEFAVGKVWPLNWHQYRRTGAVNMFASGAISDSSMQQQLKHSSRLMPLYYGRNNSRLHLNKEVETAVITAMYESQATAIKAAASGDRFVSPHLPERKEALAEVVVHVLSDKDMKGLVAMARTGSITFRQNRLGGCMKAGMCEYGGIESIAHCSGRRGQKPCPDVLYDREKAPQIRIDLNKIMEELKRSPVGSPRHMSLVEEAEGMEKFLNDVAIE